MSAFIVDKRHIDVLVELAHRGPSRAPQYPGDGYHSPRWFATEPQEGWTIQDFQAQSRTAEFDNLDEVGAMLLGECIASVQYRYHGEDVATLPGTIAQVETWGECGAEAYRFERLPRDITAVEGLKAIDCYEYQSCEHPDWKRSEAFRFCESLRDTLKTLSGGVVAA